MTVKAGAKLVAEIATLVDGTLSETRQGRWRLNAGSEMVVTVPGLNKDEPIRLVVELSTVKPKSHKVVALSDHASEQVIGYWDKFECLESGVEADLHVIAPQGPHEAAVLAEAVKVGAYARTGTPVQVSIGAEAGPNGKWQRVKAGETVKVNGRDYTGDDETPLFILRNGQIYESSIVTFGADSETGRVAAKKPTSQPETTMSDKLKVLLKKYPEKHHGLVARCVAEDIDEADITTKVHAADMDDKDKELKAAKDRICQLEDELKQAKASEGHEDGGAGEKRNGAQAKADDDQMEAEGDDYAQKGNVSQERESERKLVMAGKSSKKAVKFGGTDGAEENGKRVAAVSTLTQAMKLTASKHPELKGFALRRKARADFPNAEEA